jgi:hypothetical protein
MTVTTTYLAMFAPDQLRPRYADDGCFQVQAVETPGLLTFRALWDGEPIGYFELSDDGQCGIEIEYFGLLPGHYGRGLRIYRTETEEAQITRRGMPRGGAGDPRSCC